MRGVSGKTPPLTVAPASGFAAHCASISNEFHESERAKNMIIARKEYESLKHILLSESQKGKYTYRHLEKPFICSCLIELLEEDNFVCHNGGRAVGSLMNVIDIEW